MFSGSEIVLPHSAPSLPQSTFDLLPEGQTSSFQTDEDLYQQAYRSGRYSPNFPFLTRALIACVAFGLPLCVYFNRWVFHPANWHLTTWRNWRPFLKPVGVVALSLISLWTLARVKSCFSKSSNKFGIYKCHDPNLQISVQWLKVNAIELRDSLSIEDGPDDWLNCPMPVMYLNEDFSQWTNAGSTIFDRYLSSNLQNLTQLLGSSDLPFDIHVLSSIDMNQFFKSLTFADMFDNVDPMLWYWSRWRNQFPPPPKSSNYFSPFNLIYSFWYVHRFQYRYWRILYYKGCILNPGQTDPGSLRVILGVNESN